MSDLNDFKVSGRIVRDAVLTTTKNGKQVALLTLAVNKTYKDADGTYCETVNYFPISIFVKTEKLISHLKKGQALIVEGYLKQVTKELNDENDSKHKFDSRTYMCTSRIHFIWTNKKEDVKQDILEEDVGDFMIEAKNAQDDIYDDIYIDDNQLF